MAALKEWFAKDIGGGDGIGKSQPKWPDRTTPSP